MARRQPGEIQPRQLHAIGDRLLLHAGQRGAGNRRRFRGRARLDVAEPLLDEPARLRRLEIAGHHQARVGRRVVLLEKRHHIVVARRREVLHVADDRPVVRVAVPIQQLAQDDLGDAVRPILDRLAPLVLDDVTLGVDGFRRHRVEQIAHAIGLEEQRELERARRHVDPVVRAIGLGRPVVVAPGRLEPLVELARLHVTRAHEHEVLEEVRETGALRELARRADVVPHVHADHRNAVILVEDHHEPVRQREARVRHVDSWRGRRAGGRLRDGRRRQGDEEENNCALHPAILPLRGTKDTEGTEDTKERIKYARD